MVFPSFICFGYIAITSGALHLQMTRVWLIPEWINSPKVRSHFLFRPFPFHCFVILLFSAMNSVLRWLCSRDHVVYFFLAAFFCALFEEVLWDIKVWHQYIPDTGT